MAQQFQVPQFIEHEAKLIGPLTVKQTVLFSGVGAIIFVLWFTLVKWLFFLIAFPLILLTALIVLMKVNGRPLIEFFTSFFSFFISPQLYIWQKREKQTKKGKGQKVEIFEGVLTKTTKQEIKNLAKKLNQNG